MEADKDEDQVDTDMADAAPADEPEVQSPLKKAPAPEASADKPSTAAASGGAPSSRAKLVVKPAGESGTPTCLVQSALCSVCHPTCHQEALLTVVRVVDLILQESELQKRLKHYGAGRSVPTDPFLFPSCQYPCCTSLTCIPFHTIQPYALLMPVPCTLSMRVPCSQHCPLSCIQAQCRTGPQAHCCQAQGCQTSSSTQGLQRHQQQRCCRRRQGSGCCSRSQDAQGTDCLHVLQC